MRSRWILVQHDSDEARAVRVVGHQEAVELDPVGRHARLELVDGPPALLGVAGEGPVVRLDPRLLVAARLRRPGWRAAGSPRRRRRPAGGRRASGAGRVRGRSPARGARSSSAGPACMTHKWIGARRRRLGHGAPDQGGASAARRPPPRAAGSTTTCSDGRPVAGRGEEGGTRPARRPRGPARRARRPAPRRGAVTASSWGSGSGGWSSAASARASRSRRAPPGPGRVELGQVDHRHVHESSTPANVTRYREPVAKPRTPKGRARLTVERLAERYPGTAKELCALDFNEPVPAAGGHHPVGPEHRRAGQHGDAGALRGLPRRRRRWRRRTPRTSRRSSAPPASSGPRPRASSAWRPRWCERFGGEVPAGARGSRDHPGRRAQDGQRRAQRGLRAPGSSRRHPRAAGERAPRPDRGAATGRSGATRSRSSTS